MMRRLLSFAPALVALGFPGLVAASPPQLSGAVAGYHLTALTQLPDAPQKRRQECSFPPPTSPEAQALAAQGWQVIDEALLGQLRAVSFAPSTTNGPSGSCLIEGGNLGLFEAGKIIALVWSEADRDLSLGSLEQDQPQRLRLMDGAMLETPAADLVLDAQGNLALLPLPEVESHCGGTVQVPVAWGDPLGKARPDLLAAGWTPAPASDPGEAARELIAEGFPEAEDCAGSGANYCSFSYTTAGATLRVITIGESEGPLGPAILRYELGCQGGPKTP